MARVRRSFGKIKTLPSGRYHASYVAPNGQRYNGPNTFTAKVDAEGWLAGVRRRIELEVWVEPGSALDAAETFRDYSKMWVNQRQLKPRTRAGYEDLLRLHILPTLGNLPLNAITPKMIRAWHSSLGHETPTRNAHAYGLLHAILATALDDEMIDANPARIRGAMTTKRARKINLITTDQLAELAATMPDRLKCSVLLAAWCGLRWGETSELRRKDVSADCTTLHVRRAVVYRRGEFIVSTPKTEAGRREIAIPPHIVDTLNSHMLDHVGKGKESLLFPAAAGGHLGDYEYRKSFKAAATKIGRDDVRVHDLRHVGAVLAAHAGATTAELMLRLGHTTPAMALKYQHVAAGRDTEIAARLSKLVEGKQ